MSYRQISQYYFVQLDYLKEVADMSKITSYEAAFLDSLWESQERYKEHMCLSEKQQEVLRIICRKHD